MKLSDLRDSYKTARQDDSDALFALQAAQAHKEKTAGDVVESKHDFATGLQRVGGQAVDVSVNPPILYTLLNVPDEFTETPITAIDEELPDEPSPGMALATPSAQQGLLGGVDLLTLLTKLPQYIEQFNELVKLLKPFLDAIQSASPSAITPRRLNEVSASLQQHGALGSAVTLISLLKDLPAYLQQLQKLLEVLKPFLAAQGR